MNFSGLLSAAMSGIDEYTPTRKEALDWSPDWLDPVVESVSDGWSSLRGLLSSDPENLANTERLRRQSRGAGRSKEAVQDMRLMQAEEERRRVAGAPTSRTTYSEIFTSPGYREDFGDKSAFYGTEYAMPGYLQQPPAPIAPESRTNWRGPARYSQADPGYTGAGAILEQANAAQSIPRPMDEWDDQAWQLTDFPYPHLRGGLDRQMRLSTHRRQNRMMGSM